MWLVYINPWKEYPKTLTNEKQQRQLTLTPEAFNYKYKTISFILFEWFVSFFVYLFIYDVCVVFDIP